MNMTNIQKLLDFAKDLVNNYDCDCYDDTECRTCKAENIAREVMGDDLAESLFEGPYFSNVENKEVFEYLVEQGQPIKHLSFGG